MAEDSNNLHDNTIGWTIITILLGLVLWLVWVYFDTEIRNTIRWLRYGEMWLLQWILPQDYTFTYGDRTLNWSEWFAQASKFKATELTDQHLGLFSMMTMQPLKIPFCVALGLGAVWAILKGPRTQYRSTLGLEGLIQRQAPNFPVIAPFLNFNPSKQPPRPPGSPVPAELPLFAEALGPEEWVAYNQVPCPDGHLHQLAAKKIFYRQLIGRWKGAGALKPYQQILLAAFCLKASRKRDDSDIMLGRIARCWSADKGLQLKRDKALLKEARQVLRSKELAKKTLAAANRHAFVTTAMLGALRYAREQGGVLAPAQFVWLRGHDRTLWYPLNNLGRESLHIEALGAHAHFKAESMTKRPIPTPKVDKAVGTISEYMNSENARPIPALDYKNSKKRGVKKAI